MATKAARKQLAKEVAPVQAAKEVAPKRKVISRTAASFATKASKKQPVRPLRGDEPNDETAQVLRESLEGKNLVRFESLEAMFADLEI
ncbi:MAG: hypothetical protein ACLP53_06165 [Isosphaeraceae bacterium]